jgi:hypothetical protein
MASLSVTFGKELSQPLTEIYWDALKPMAIEQFQEGAKSWIRHGKHFPKPAELLDRLAELTQAKPKEFIPLPPADRKWLGLVNAMFLQYLRKRRLEDGFVGNINLPFRREACLSLVEFFEGIAADGDEEATEAQLQIRFDRAMSRISDVSNDIAWLDVELERQKLEDRAKDQRQKAHAA